MAALPKLTSMSRRLLAKCKAEPDDDAPRLALADWLEKHEQSDWAELVRLQVARQGRVRQEVAGYSLERERALERMIETRYGEPFREHCGGFHFERGLARVWLSLRQACALEQNLPEGLLACV